MTIKEFENQAGDQAREFYDYHSMNEIRHLTCSMNIKNYKELIESFKSLKINMIQSKEMDNFLNKPHIFTSFRLPFNVLVHLVKKEEEGVGWGKGDPLDHQKFFKVEDLENNTSVIQMQTLPHRA